MGRYTKNHLRSTHFIFAFKICSCGQKSPNLEILIKAFYFNKICIMIDYGQVILIGSD